jgi:hypothetical protein
MTNQQILDETTVSLTLNSDSYLHALIAPTFNTQDVLSKITQRVNHLVSKYHSEDNLSRETVTYAVTVYLDNMLEVYPDSEYIPMLISAHDDFTN